MNYLQFLDLIKTSCQKLMILPSSITFDDIQKMIDDFSEKNMIVNQNNVNIWLNHNINNKTCYTTQETRVKLTEICNSINESTPRVIDFTSYKAFSNNYTEDVIRIKLTEICDFMEANFNIKIFGVFMIGSDAKVILSEELMDGKKERASFPSYTLDYIQVEKLQMHFGSFINECESINGFVLLSLDV